MTNQLTPLPKGFLMEELLRGYFLKAGYYVIRSVPFVYEGFDITDIDIWLYSRSSSVSREITIVDSKNKKTPQAIERIFWVQGLRIATKATNAIVATTDKRQAVRDFGLELGVQVLDGGFLRRLNMTGDPNVLRISEEELAAKISDYSLGKLDGDWRGRMNLSKSLLSKSLSFDSCNEWLGHGKFFAEQSVINSVQQHTALRCLYLICSFIAIALDYCLRELSFYEQHERHRLITEGFTYGSKGSEGIDRILKVAVGLVEQHATGGKVIGQQVRAGVERQIAALNTTVLGDYFSRPDVAKSVFSVAKEFEELAMVRTFSGHSQSSAELKSMLFCLLDYWDIGRTMFN